MASKSPLPRLAVSAIATLAVLFLSLFPLRAQILPSPRQRILFDRNWRFQQGDAAGAEAPGFDDSAWRPLNLPHDWMIEGVKGQNPQDMDGPFDKGSPAGAGGAYLNGGIGWYRKTFSLPPAGQGRHVTLLFDGAYMNADVWLNGRHLGMHPYGFTSFSYDITPALAPGKNVLAVKLNVQQPGCRWYSGAGLYRHVWLIETSPVHAGLWGTYVTTPEISASSTRVRVQTKVQNDGAASQPVELTTRVLDPSGKEAGHVVEQKQIAPRETASFDGEIEAAEPQLWSVETPVLYKAVTEVRIAGELVDTVETPFGIRTILFTKDKGFFLNGKHVRIQGVCDHHDLGALGSAAYGRGLERQLEILKGMGCNALRTSHNPPAPELLDLCDRMGFLVMDEAFDEWKENHAKHGYADIFDQWSEPDMVSMLDRDRNHPAIVLWSIGNEIPEGREGKPSAGLIAQRLVAICHREDPTRPVTSACPGPDADWKSGLAKALDVFGVNYNPDFYARNAPQSAGHPPGGPDRYPGGLPLVGSETQSQVDTRSEYGLSLDAQGHVKMDAKPHHQVSSYDPFHPFWANSPDTEFAALEKSPWVAGEYVWTGFDYLGEPTPFTWPSRSSYFGIVDLCGFPKDRYYQFKAHWRPEPLVHLLPHWTWPGFEGKPIPVQVFTNADSVELFLNGKSLGSKGEKQHLSWSVTYQPGELKAVARKNGQTVATDIVKTAGAPAKIVAGADRAEIESGDQDLSFIKVTILDKDGNVCPNAATELSFAVEGHAAAIAALDNGDPTNHESFQGTQHQAFHGLALAVLKSHADETGPVTLKISGPGLQPAAVTIQVLPARSKRADQVM